MSTTMYRVNGGEWFSSLEWAKANATMPVISIETGKLREDGAVLPLSITLR